MRELALFWGDVGGVSAAMMPAGLCTRDSVVPYGEHRWRDAILFFFVVLDSTRDRRHRSLTAVQNTMPLALGAIRLACFRNYVRDTS